MNNNFFGQYYTCISIFAFFGSLRDMCPLYQVTKFNKYRYMLSYILTIFLCDNESSLHVTNNM